MVSKFTDSLVAIHASLVSRLGRHPLLNLKGVCREILLPRTNVSVLIELGKMVL